MIWLTFPACFALGYWLAWYFDFDRIVREAVMGYLDNGRELA